MLIDAPEPDLSAWPGLTIAESVTAGHRNRVWRGRAPSGPVAIRASSRSLDSLAWELDLLCSLDELGFVVPRPLPTESGQLHTGPVSVHRWIDGREPTTSHDWGLVASDLQRLHSLTAGWGQRPGCRVVTELGPTGSSVDAALGQLPSDVRELVRSVFSEFGDAPVAVIHGDPGAPNLRVTDDGRIAFLDWDESRVDVTYHDLSNLGVRVLDPDLHGRAVILSHAWETANGWIAEPEYAQERLRQLEAALS